jgi:hypothetical protein
MAHEAWRETGSGASERANMRLKMEDEEMTIRKSEHRIIGLIEHKAQDHKITIRSTANPGYGGQVTREINAQDIKI